MKLTVRKKIVLLGAILLAILTTIALVVLSTEEKGASVVSRRKESNSKQFRTQAISEIQSSLNSKNVKTDDLLAKLKEKKFLKPSEVD